MQSLRAAKAFVDAINSHDASAIVALSTSDHRFFDSLGETLAVDMLLAGWEGYFGMVPDYRIQVTQWIVHHETVVALGIASGTFTTDGAPKPENSWSTPAAWRAVVSEGRVAEWQVYTDNEPIRRIMRLNGFLE